ncbi:MAG: 30S ribosomal protein S6 [Planctomycetota bacterium]
MKRTYESMLLLDNREVRKGWQPLKEQVCTLFTKHGAAIKSAKRWDERRLAYPIQRQLRGTYMLVFFEAETPALAGIRRDLEFSEPVLRHLTLVAEAIPESAFEPEAAFDESQVRVEDVTTVPVPEAVAEDNAIEVEDGPADAGDAPKNQSGGEE